MKNGKDFLIKAMASDPEAGIAEKIIDKQLEQGDIQGATNTAKTALSVDATGYGRVALLRRPYKLSKNPLNGIRDADFKIRGFRPEEFSTASSHMKNTFYNPWAGPGETGGTSNELLSSQPLDFVTWVEHPDITKTFLNGRTYKQGGKIKNDKETI